MSTKPLWKINREQNFVPTYTMVGRCNWSRPCLLQQQSTDIGELVTFHQAWPTATGGPSQNTHYQIHSMACINLWNIVLFYELTRNTAKQTQRLIISIKHISNVLRHDTIPNSPSSLQLEITWQPTPFRHQSQPGHRVLKLAFSKIASNHTSQSQICKEI